MHTTDELCDELGLNEKIRKVHSIITEHHPIGTETFDAWYTDNEFVLKELLKLGREIARDLRTGRYQWTKGLPQEVSEELRKAGIVVSQWEDGPDGALAGLAILLSAWIANQSAAKTSYNSSDAALGWFDGFVRPAILSAIDCGKQYATKEKKEESD